MPKKQLPQFVAPMAAASMKEPLILIRLEQHERFSEKKVRAPIPDRKDLESNQSHEQSIERLVLIISLLGILLIPSAAFAHHAEWMKGKPFIQGLSMPVHGLDHMLVTFAVGLIAVQIGGYALWAVPAAFSLLLLLGGVGATTTDSAAHQGAHRRLGFHLGFFLALTLPTKERAEVEAA